MTNQWLHGLHDVDGAALMGDRPGWLVVTEAIGCDPGDHSGANYLAWASRGYGIIARLNNGYAPAGTIPTPEKYADFVRRCANFVGATPGVNLVIIGNEPNHSNEWPNGQKIDPADYANCYRGCRQAIHSVKPDCKVLVAGCAPWDNESGLDWLDYWKIVTNAVYPCDGFAIHAYTHGADPGLIFSDEKRNGWYWHFRTYRDQLACLEGDARKLPVYITETDQGDDAWADVNSGWVQNAYAEIDAWNQQNIPAIRALCLYCTHQRDRWYIMDKSGVQADFRAAVAKGYQSPMLGTAPQPPSQPTLPPRVIDPRAVARGVTVETPTVAPGQTFWFAKGINWLDEQESQGRHHIYGDCFKDGAKKAGIVLVVTWPSGSAQILTEDKSADTPPWDYWYNFPMSPSLNEFSIQVDDSMPSEIVKGIGMGADGNSHIHTSTVVEWVLTTMPGNQPNPIPPTSAIKTGQVSAPAGVNVRAAPSVDAAKLGALAYASTVLYDNAENGWLHLADGWVSADYVGPVNATSTAPVTTPQQPAQPSGDNWARAWPIVLDIEGGLSTDPNDPGNYRPDGTFVGTKFGISANAHPDVDIVNLTKEQALEIYRRDYWQASGADKLPWPMSLVVFDTAVQHGVGVAKQLLNDKPTPEEVYLGQRALRYFDDPNWARYGVAWGNRIKTIRSQA